MNSKTVLLLSLAAASLVPSARADVDVRIDAEIRIGRALPPPPPEVVIVEQVGPPGPPPWSRGRWYRRSHAYYYYPGSDVYYRPSDRVWFYLDGGDWRFGARLPDGIRVDFGHSVSLKLETNRPYTYHREVVAYYPPTYWSKVRFKDRRDNRVDRRDDRTDRRDDRRDRREDRRGDDDRGKGKGRDNDR
ncbi:MAG TPA: hypothetical protein VIK52_09915 [Opitutaceae bacterium]